MILLTLMLALRAWILFLAKSLAQGLGAAVPARPVQHLICGPYNAPLPDGQDRTPSLPNVCRAYTPQATHPDPVDRPTKSQRRADRTAIPGAAARTGKPAGSVTARAPRPLGSPLIMQLKVVIPESVCRYRFPLFSECVHSVTPVPGQASPDPQNRRFYNPNGRSRKPNALGTTSRRSQ